MENRQVKTKKLIETAIMIALMVVLSVVNIYIPIGQFILPIPVTIVYIRSGFKYSLSAVVITGIIMGMIINPIMALTSIISFGIIGIVVGYCIKNNQKVSKTLLFSAIGFLLSYVLTFSLYLLLIGGKDLISFLNQNLQPVRDSLDMYKNLMPNEETLNILNQYKEVLKTENLVKIIPSALIIGSTFFAYINYGITVYVLRKIRYTNIKKGKSFSYIHINIKLGTIIAICLLLGSILKRFNLSLGEYIFITSLIVLQIIFIINGVTCVVYYLKNKFKVSKGVMIFILIITLFSGIFIIYIFIGLFDMVFDFRKLDSFRSYKKK